MAKLYFYYSAMNAGKSTTLIQSAYNYQERGMRALLFTSRLDTRAGQGAVRSRLGINTPALLFDPDTDFLRITAKQQALAAVHCLLIDEAQFLQKEQVWQLTEVVDRLGIPVLCYGIRTDFRGELFTGSLYLLAWADILTELKTICFCGSKATFVVRINHDGAVVKEGSQIEIGGNEKYLSVCRRHFKDPTAK